MPPSNTGSRATMVGWIVATSIVGVVAVIYGIYAYVEVNRTTDRLHTLENQYKDVVGSDGLRGEEVAQLKAAREAPNAAEQGINASMKLLDVALAQRANLSKLISGAPDDTAAMAAAQNAIAKAKEAGVKPAGDSLNATIDALVTELRARQTEAENNRKDSQDSQSKLRQTVDATQKQIDSLTKTMEALRAEKDQALQQVQEITGKQRGDFENTAGEMRQQLVTAQEQINQVNTQNADLADQIKKKDAIIAQLQEKLGLQRVDPATAIVRQADGQIIRIPGSGICFINLGLGDQVTAGLTFEVYDKIEGIPQPGDPSTDEDLPAGKASIEVVRVSQTSSECRITHQAIGTTLSEGDLIVNLVYDRNTKYNFVVHGNFDLDQNGVATAQDAEIIKRLITQWGGTISDQINANTDFVVLGKEPVIPDKPEDPNDALAVKNYEDALAAYERYGDVSQEARSYRIPILNQNRFLYLVGYYHQAKR